MKYWSCCKRKTSDFNTFLAQEGCTTGTHVWTKKDAVSSINICAIAGQIKSMKLPDLGDGCVRKGLFQTQQNWGSVYTSGFLVWSILNVLVWLPVEQIQRELLSSWHCNVGKKNAELKSTKYFHLRFKRFLENISEFNNGTECFRKKAGHMLDTDEHTIPVMNIFFKFLILQT